ncbi:MAG: PQQ-like beta-propeller repeat protein [Deltaproteobacteria bacterium]|nr:PQQ-like beta-propeller repeat protein [Deltaproteobacteria bacterium]
MRSKSSRIFSLATASVLSALVFGCAAERPKADMSPWASYLHDPSRTNAVAEGPKMPLVLSWAKDVSEITFVDVFPREQLSSPVISDGVLYVGSENEKFYSLKLTSGRVYWKYDARYPIEAPPAVEGGTVCFGASNGVMRCFDKVKGNELWSFQARSEILSSPVIRDGRLYFSSSDDRVYSLSLKDGARLWTYNRSTFQTVAPRVYSSPAFFEGKLYQLFSDGSLVCLSADTGKDLWSAKVLKDFNQPSGVRRTPLVDNGLVYVIGDSQNVVALDASTGEVRNSFGLIKARDFILHGGRAMIIAGSDRIISVDRLSGEILWKKELKFNPVSSIFVAGDTLFVLSNYSRAPLGLNIFAKTNGRIEALRLSDAETLWGHDLYSTASANASTAESHVAVLTDKGVIDVFGPK